MRGSALQNGRQTVHQIGYSGRMAITIIKLTDSADPKTQIEIVLLGGTLKAEILERTDVTLTDPDLPVENANNERLVLLGTARLLVRINGEHVIPVYGLADLGHCVGKECLSLDVLDVLATKSYLEETIALAGTELTRRTQ